MRSPVDAIDFAASIDGSRAGTGGRYWSVRRIDCLNLALAAWLPDAPVEAPPGLLAGEPGGNHSLEQRRHAEVHHDPRQAAGRAGS